MEDNDLPPKARTKYAVSELFLGAFECALKLKAQLILSEKRYILAFPKPGDGFNPRTMARDGNYDDHKILERKRKAVHESGGEQIKLCIFPALYFVPNDSTKHDRDNLVQYNNFIDDADDLVAGSRLMVKAVVIV